MSRNQQAAHGKSQTRDIERTGIRGQELGGRWDASSTFTDGERHDAETVHALENFLRDALRDESDGSRVLAHLIDGQDTITDEVGLRGGKLREDESGTIAKEHLGGKSNGLEMLGLSWSGRNGNLLLADESVDGRGFSDVGVSYEADDHALRRVAMSNRNCKQMDRGQTA